MNFVPYMLQLNCNHHCRLRHDMPGPFIMQHKHVSTSIPCMLYDFRVIKGSLIKSITTIQLVITVYQRKWLSSMAFYHQMVILWNKSSRRKKVDILSCYWISFCSSFEIYSLVYCFNVPKWAKLCEITHNLLHFRNLRFCWHKWHATVLAMFVTHPMPGRRQAII